MLIIPSIDLFNGKVVRLYQGNINHMTVYSTDPMAIAQKWQASGAEMIHLIDLNGALYNQDSQLPFIKKLIKNTRIPFQFGGGIRTFEKAEEILSYGAVRIILSTLAWRFPEKLSLLVKLFGNKIAVAIDSKNGKTAISGWKEYLNETPENFVKKYHALGVNTFIYTDITKDGSLHSPAFVNIKKVMKIADTDFYLSGGFNTFSDIKKAYKLGAAGVIIGKAFYEKTMDYQQIKGLIS